MFAGVIFLPTLAAAAHANGASAEFTVTARVESVCRIAAPDLVHADIARKGSTYLSMQCANSVPYSVTLDTQNGLRFANGASGTRFLTANGVSQAVTMRAGIAQARSEPAVVEIYY